MKVAMAAIALGGLALAWKMQAITITSETAWLQIGLTAVGYIMAVGGTAALAVLAKEREPLMSI